MNPFGTWGQLARRANEFEIITSADATADLDEALAQPRLRARLARFMATAEFGHVMDALAGAEMIADPPEISVCRDADDDVFFACAVAGHADYIVSEDEDILAIGEYEGVRTVRAAAFVRVLDGDR